MCVIVSVFFWGDGVIYFREDTVCHRLFVDGNVGAFQSLFGVVLSSLFFSGCCLRWLTRRRFHRCDPPAPLFSFFASLIVAAISPCIFLGKRRRPGWTHKTSTGRPMSWCRRMRSGNSSSLVYTPESSSASRSGRSEFIYTFKIARRTS